MMPMHSRGNRYAFLGELRDSLVQQVSIEAAQPNLDLSVLEELPNKTIILGVLNLGDMQVETPEVVAERIRAAGRYLPPERLIVSTDCGFGREGLSRRIAFYKCVAIALGTNIVRRELRLPEARVAAADPRFA